jgi:Tannase and feruloyl esterase
MSTKKGVSASVCIATMMLTACGGGGDSDPAQAAPVVPVAAPLDCQRMMGLSVASSAIALPTSGAVVTSATVVPASGTGSTARPEYCLVAGDIKPVDTSAPSIKFNLALPTNWNSKAMMFGGGGMDGSIPSVAGNVPAGPTNQPVPLARGYAVFGSDSGHHDSLQHAINGLDGTFGLNDEALNNWSSGDALKKTRDVAISLIKSRYAAGAPLKSYFAGGSTGGREALTVIQRWPEDWDGAIALYPARAGMVSILGGHRMNRALAQPGAYPNAAKRDLLFKAAYEMCDAMDGVVDGLISNQVKCNAKFDPSTAKLAGVPIRCPNGADTGDTCLSDAQITAMKAINTPTNFNYLASGETQHPGYNIWGADTGISTRTSPLEPTVTILAFGTSQPTIPMPETAPYISVFTDQWIKYHVTRDPSYDSLSLDPENPGAWAGRISMLSTMLDAKTDLSKFAAKGGKLLMAHGVNDVLVSTRSTEAYFNTLLDQLGPTQLDGFARYYEIPGYNHALSTVFNAAWDSLSALEAWAEKGVAPTNQIVTDTAGVPGRTRPLCQYPAWPQYKGTGDVNAAASFNCVTQ